MMVNLKENRQPHLLIRADGNSEIGVGHLFRSLALAQAWRELPGSVTFLAAECPEFFTQQLLEEGIGFKKLRCQIGDAADLSATCNLITQEKPHFVVLDGYNFGYQFQHGIKASGHNLLVMDDFGHCDRYAADYILNPNPIANKRMYPVCADSTEFLFGFDYALLRREFHRSRKQPDTSKPQTQALKLLLTFGGGEYNELIGEILASLPQFAEKSLAITVVAGGSGENYQQLCSWLKTLPIKLKTLHNIYNIHEVMKRADVAVAAAGGTALELACLGVPSLLVVVADNQQMNAEALQQKRAAINLGKRSRLTPEQVSRELAKLIADPETFAEMRESGMAIIDGKGARRVVAKVLEKSYGRAEVFPDA